MKNESKILELLDSDLDFENDRDSNGRHNLHSFPAKFPPQLPRKFIRGLTEPNEIVLDPMMGSGTTVLEAYQNQRRGIGYDYDPMAVLIAKTKLINFDSDEIVTIGQSLLDRIKHNLHSSDIYLSNFRENLDLNTLDFIDYWFSEDAQNELALIIGEINKIKDFSIRDFFKILFSSIIITKSGGVSLSFDLAHTRPHRAKIAFSKSGEILLGKDIIDKTTKRIKLLTKKYRSAVSEFEKKLKQSIGSFEKASLVNNNVIIKQGDARCLDLTNSSVDLIVTSPPYASNAIDYMRAHKFSLVWFGFSISELRNIRGRYIGNDSTANAHLNNLPKHTSEIILKLRNKDRIKGAIVSNYYDDMKKVIIEMYRVLKPNKSAIIVVGSSKLKSIDIDIANCLSEIGKQTGFSVPKIAIRNIDRNRRMLPVGNNVNEESQIQNRMHKEYVIAFQKS